MPFGAHETIEMHEVLMEKLNTITHFNLYARETKHPQLLDMIGRHHQEAVRSYNEIVSLAHGSTRFATISPNTNVRVVGNQQVQYGLHNPPQFAPQPDAILSDSEIAIAMLLCHKNGARNCTWASLECADPNLRRALLNSAITCNNQAYEVFVFMNQQGLYQVPTLNSQTTQTFIQSYQPASGSLQTQFGVANPVNTGATTFGGPGAVYPNTGVAGVGAPSFQYQAGAPYVNANVTPQGAMRQ